MAGTWRMLLLALPFFAPVTCLANDTCKIATGYADPVMQNDTTKDAYQSALIMGHISEAGDGYICVNGLKITYDANTNVSNGNILTHDFDDLPVRAEVEIAATPQPGNDVMVARAVNLQYTVAGGLQTSSSIRNLDILDETSHFDDPFAPDIINYGSSYIISGVRRPSGNKVIHPLFVRYGQLNSDGYGRITRVTGILHRDEKSDLMGTKTYRFLIGNTVIHTDDEATLQNYVGKEMVARGAWTRGMNESFIELEVIEETPFTAAYNPATQPTYISVEHFLTGNEKKDNYKLYNIDVDDKAGHDFMEHLSEHQRHDTLVIGTGELLPNAGAHITAVTRSFLPAPVSSRIEFGFPHYHGHK